LPSDFIKDIFTRTNSPVFLSVILRKVEGRRGDLKPFSFKRRRAGMRSILKQREDHDENTVLNKRCTIRYRKIL